MAAVPEGFRYLPGYVDAEVQAALIAALRALAEAAPLYRPTMPKSGRPFSVRMTNAGSNGWFSDREGYRYIRRHPESGRPWPPIPAALPTLVRVVPGYPARSAERRVGRAGVSTCKPRWAPCPYIQK